MFSVCWWHINVINHAGFLSKTFDQFVLLLRKDVNQSKPLTITFDLEQSSTSSSLEATEEKPVQRKLLNLFWWLIHKIE